MKTIQISRLPYLRSPQEFKRQDSNQEGDKLVTAEDSCQQIFPGVAGHWVFLPNQNLTGVGVGGGFPKPEIHSSILQWKMQPASVCYEYHSHFTHSLTHTHTTNTQNKLSYNCSNWSALQSLIPRAFKEKEPAISYRLMTQRTICTCLFSFLEIYGYF